MDILGKSSVYSWGLDQKMSKMTSLQIRSAVPYRARSDQELILKIAELQYKNPSFCLFFRGQPDDFSKPYKKGGNISTIEPNIYRGVKSESASPSLIHSRFERLKKAEALLVGEIEPLFSQTDATRIKRQRILRWSIIQHYEVAKTPLLDITPSLRVALSFALLDRTDRGFIHVLAMPSPNGTVTADIASGVQLVRLTSLCSNKMNRPHYQQGYVASEFPDIMSAEDKSEYGTNELDFGRRLIGKFEVHREEFGASTTNSPKGFDALPLLPREFLYPNDEDPMYKLGQQIKSQLPPES